MLASEWTESVAIDDGNFAVRFLESIATRVLALTVCSSCRLNDRAMFRVNDAVSIIQGWQGPKVALDAILH